MSLQRLSIVTLVASTLFACSSNDDVTQRIQELEDANKERIAAYNEEQQEAREAELEIVPKWYLSPPDSDATGFYGVGYAKSKNLGHGLKAARLQAEFSLAKMYQQELSGSERAFERGDSEGNVTSQTTFLIDKIIDAVPVVGYQVVEQKMTPLNGVYEAFVLLKLPYDEFNRILQDQKKGEIDNTVQQAFDDLERRLTSRRAQKEAERQAAHQRELESIEARNATLQQTDGPSTSQPEPSSGLN
jgi:hypothetical protein